MDSVATTYAKAVDDLAGKIFIPALIASLLVEIGPLIQGKLDTNLLVTYLIVAAIGLISAPLILYGVIMISITFFKGHDVGPEIGVVLMPLGFAGLFPDHFQELGIPYSQVTGVAILAWSFMLVRGKQFFRGFFWGD